MLEDNYEDILYKALIALKIGKTELSERINEPQAAIKSLLAGSFKSPIARKIAKELKLNPEALIAIGEKIYAPNITKIPNLEPFSTNFHAMKVNSYIIWDTKTSEAAIFDTGADASEMIQFITKYKLTPKIILLTHSHPDHIAALSTLQIAYHNELTTLCHPESSVKNSSKLKNGQALSLGNLNIKTIYTPGHSKDGITFYITGLDYPIAVTGDALFAGSMGGASGAYQTALASLKTILDLPENTILCPGHGPLTNVALEKKHNPFFCIN